MTLKDSLKRLMRSAHKTSKPFARGAGLGALLRSSFRRSALASSALASSALASSDLGSLDLASASLSSSESWPLSSWPLSSWPTAPTSLSHYHRRLSLAYRKNAVCYRAIRMVAEACATIPLSAHGETRAAPALDTVNEILQMPHPDLEGRQFLDQIVTTLLVHGNAYIERVSGEQRPWLYPVAPEHMQVAKSQAGIPSVYLYRCEGREERFDQLQKVQPILHLRCFDPARCYHGTSPLEAAASAIMIHNAANDWTQSLFENAARPSGAFIFKGRDGHGQLTQEQYDRLRQELEENFQGARNAGRPLLLEGGMDWHSLSLSPQDMDFIAAKYASARDIALALGVPPMLLGIPGDNTYANYAEANRVFWRGTILPLAERLARALTRFLSQEYAGVEVRCEIDQLPAFSEERYRLWARIGAASFMSDDEKRAAVGLPPRAADEG